MCMQGTAIDRRKRTRRRVRDMRHERGSAVTTLQ
jgi:hypothetical protein